MLTSYRPGVKGTYSTLQLPSLLSLQDIFDSDGPSTVMPRPPIPAPLIKEQHTQNQPMNFTLIKTLSALLSPAVPGDDVEVVGLLSQGLLESGAGSHDPAGVTSLRHGNLERTLRNRCVVIQNLDAVDA